MAAPSLVSSLGFLRGQQEPSFDGAMTDEDYTAAGKISNSAELASGEDSSIFRLFYDDEGFDALFEVPFALKHVKDLHVVMRHAVAVAGERREDLTRHSLFHPAFAAFALGFAIGLAQAHRSEHGGFRDVSRLSRRQLELCEQWGVEIATYYIALIDVEGIFDKDADVDLYGISDKWRLLADERRVEQFDQLAQCLAVGKRAAHLWFADATADVPPYFLDALASFVAAYPESRF